MSAGTSALSEAAFIADLDPRERSVWRFLATLVVGLGSGFLAALAIGVIAVFAIAFAGGMFTGGLEAIRRNMGGLIDNAGQSADGGIVLMMLAVATNGPLALTFVGFAALFTGRRAIRYVTTTPTVRWTLLLWGLVSSLLIVGPVAALGQLADPHAPIPPVIGLAHDLAGRVVYVAATFLLLIPAAAAEEVVFRGWLLRQSAAVTRNPLVLMAVNGLLFSAIHFDFSPDAFLQRAIMGAGFVYMTLRLGGIEFSTGAHAANNILIVLLIQPLTVKAGPPGGLSVDGLLQDAFLFASYIATTELTARWAPLRHWTGVDQAAARPATAEAAPFF